MNSFVCMESLLYTCYFVGECHGESFEYSFVSELYASLEDSDWMIKIKLI